MIQLAGIELIWQVQSFCRPVASSGLTHPHFSHVQSVFVIRAMDRYTGIWWFRSRSSPLIASPVLILTIDGKPNPWWATGSVSFAHYERVQLFGFF